MKLNKMILPLAVALVAMLATTGCKHSQTKITKIPGMNRQGATDEPPSGLRNPGDEPPITATPQNPFDPKNIGSPLNPDLKNLSNFHQDRATLAANTVHFDLDSSVVKDKEQIHLANVAQTLNSDMGAYLLIEGHCDERGTEEYNRALGERRAGALREALIHNGVDSQRITTISYGKDHKIDMGNTDAAHAKNRRGEFVLLHPK